MHRRRAHLVFGLAIALAAILPAAQPVLGHVGWAATATASEVVPGPGLVGAVADLTLDLIPADGDACIGTHFVGFDLDADPITAIAVHSGAAGVVGPVAFDLVVPDPPNDNGTCAQGLDPTVLEAVATNPGAYYLEVDTVAFPDGAARGQVVSHDTVQVWVVEVVCTGSGHMPSGGDVSILFERCRLVGRPGEFPTLPADYAWRLAPIELASLQFGVRSGDGSQLTLADAEVFRASYCDGTTHLCEPVAMYDWQAVATGAISVTDLTPPSKAKFETAIVVDGNGNRLDTTIDKSSRKVDFQTTGADDQVYVYIVNRK